MKTRDLLLVLLAVAQALTVVVTWSLWQVRESPVHLPLLDLPQVPFGLLMLLSLAAVLIEARAGVFLHIGCLLLSCVFDQYRLQPQFVSLAVLMLVVVEDAGPQVGRWFLASLWTWAGLHKLLSPEWFGEASWALVASLYLDPRDFQTAFAWGVGLGEVAVGLLAIFRPRWAAAPCVGLHCGIVLFLAVIGHNVSVVPWNLATAAVGAWVMLQAGEGLDVRRVWSEWVFPSLLVFWMGLGVVLYPFRSQWQTAVAVALMLYPAGFYLGWVDHGFAHVLYSGHCPEGVVTTPEASETIGGWQMSVCFPKERRLLRQYFERSANPGDLLHVSDPRALLDDQYFILQAHGEAKEITREAWQEVQEGWSVSKPEFFTSVQGSGSHFGFAGGGSSTPQKASAQGGHNGVSVDESQL